MEEAGIIAFELITPTRKLISSDVHEVTAPGKNGEFGVLPGHTPFLCQLCVGVLTYRIGTTHHHVSVMGGYIKVEDDKMSVLAEDAELATEINQERAKKSLQRAEGRLGGDISPNSFDFGRAERSRKRAITRIKVAEST